MTEPRRVPEAARPRLELLRRLLDDLETQGRQRVTSRDLARWVGATPETVRKDLAGTGTATPGAAYEISELKQRLDALLSLPPARRTALVGLGSVGLALAEKTFLFVAGFDARTNRLEQAELPFPLFPTTEIVPVCLRMAIDSAVLTDGNEAQKMAERLVQAGVRVLVNYAPTVLRVDRNRIEVWERGFRV